MNQLDLIIDALYKVELLFEAHGQYPYTLREVSEALAAARELKALAQPEQKSPHSATHSADSAEGFGKREWQGLTEDEIKKIMQRWRGEFDIRNIERLLKDKNT